jgi:hypothetical protein
MKYKVMLYTNTSGGGNPDAAGSFSFYIKAQALVCCEQWRDLSSQYTSRVAYLWDGSTWSEYAPVP